MPLRGLAAAALLALSGAASAGLYLGAYYYPNGTTLGRDGRFYTTLSNSQQLRGSGVIAITPAGTIREVTRFPLQRDSFAFNHVGISPGSWLSTGQDGAVYGATTTGGAFGGGVIYKVQPNGVRTILHHLRYSDSNVQVLAAKNGNIYVTVGFEPSQLVRLSPDGSTKTILMGNNWPQEIAETAQGEIVISLYEFHGYGDPGSSLMKLDAAEELQPFASFGTVHEFNTAAYARSLIPQADGSILCINNKALLKVLPDGTVTPLHDFATPFEGTDPGQIFVTKDGSILGYTSTGGLEHYGTIFRFAPETAEYTVLEHLPPPGRLGFGQVWLKHVFPLWAEAKSGNRPPSAKDDVVSAAALRKSTRIDVLRNDTDADHDPLTIVSVGTAEHGAVAFDFVKQQIDYSPNSTSAEYDSFSYTIVDGNGGTADARVTIVPDRTGRYHAEVTSTPNAETGDPGTPVGTLNVRVNSAGMLAGRLNILDRHYQFTGRFGERNLWAANLAADPRTGHATSLQLHLKPAGSGWEIEVLALNNWLPYIGTAQTAP